MSDRANESGWDASWEGHSLAQLQRLSKLTLIEKLEWLEQAQRTVEAMKRTGTGEVRDGGPDVSA